MSNSILFGIIYEITEGVQDMETKIKLTGLWKNTGKNGKIFLSGRLNGASSLMIFPNEFKKGEKDPDYICYLKQNEEKPGRTQEAASGNEL